MKLLFFIHSLASGGAERVTVTLANHWARQGWSVTILTMAGQDEDFYSLHPHIRRISLNLNISSSSALVAIKNNLSRIRRLRSVLERERPDVAVGMLSTANCLLALAARGTGIPAIGSERIYPPMLPMGRAWEWLRRRTYPRLAAVVAQTEQGAEWLRTSAGAKAVPVFPNPATYPLDRSEPSLPPGGGQGRKVLLAVGRLTPQKSFDRLLTAFADLAPRFPQWRLVIAGEGECRRELERLAADLGLEGRVTFPGRVGNIGDWYEAADIYVMTSRFEGFPNTLVEALAYGLPAVSVDCDTGPREILRHGVDGLLVPQDDPPALIEALDRLMCDEQLRAQFAARAIEARERFALERVAAMWGDLFERVTRGASRRM